MRALPRGLADQIAADRLVHVFGPGGHSNLAAQEIFFRAGGLMHVSAILDEGTLLSNGALRSMAMERLPGYGRNVIAEARLGEGDLLILVNAYGINAALIDAAIEARGRGGRADRGQQSAARRKHRLRPSRASSDQGQSARPRGHRDRLQGASGGCAGGHRRRGRVDRRGLDLRQRLRAQLPRHSHGRRSGRAWDRAAGLAQRQRARG